jgi:hypothetical protein
MADINHSTLTDPYLHEPKGVASAANGTAYMATGSGGGVWRKVNSYTNGYLAFDAVTPAYQHSVTTVYTPLNPTFSTLFNEDFSGSSSPNARLIFTGSQEVRAECSFVFNFKNDSGTSRDLEVVFKVNGNILNNAHIIVTANSGEWKSATLSCITSFTTNSYLEIFVKADASFTLDVASASLVLQGMPRT